MNPTTVQQQVNAAQAAGNARQQALDTQSSQLQSQYGQAQQNATALGQQASQAANGIQDAGQLYGGYLQNAQQAVGFNPQDLTQANKNLTAIQNQVAYAPTAAQQTGNYYGTTAGGTTNIYSGLMGNLNPGLTNASNTAGNLTNEYQTLAGQANQQAGLTEQSQQAKASATTANYGAAVQQMSTAGSTMSSIEAMAQQQGYLTAEQTTAYQNAYSQYVSAQAAAAQAAAATTTANAAARLTTAQAIAQEASNNATKTPAPTANTSNTFGVLKSSANPAPQPTNNDYTQLHAAVTSNPALGAILRDFGLSF